MNDEGLKICEEVGEVGFDRSAEGEVVASNGFLHGQAYCTAFGFSNLRPFQSPIPMLQTALLKVVMWGIAIMRMVSAAQRLRTHQCRPRWRYCWKP